MTVDAAERVRRSAERKLRGLKIGYAAASLDFSAPADRRRFVYYARKRELPIEYADPERSYDLVVLSQAADLTRWHRYSDQETRIVFDFVDSYLAVEKGDLKGALRGTAKYITRQQKFFEWDFHETLRRMCRRATAVVCSTEEQRSEIRNYCETVAIILDFHANAVRHMKREYRIGPRAHLVWEGFAAGNGAIFRLLRDVVVSINGTSDVALHVITDLKYGRFHGKYWERQTAEEFRKLFRPAAGMVNLYQWNEQTFSAIASACDLAILPIPLDVPFLAGKPENKLLIFWRLGIPTIVSATPAYDRAMRSCGLPMACRSLPEWRDTLHRYLADETARCEAGERGRAFAEEHHGEAATLRRWDELFESIL